MTRYICRTEKKFIKIKLPGQYYVYAYWSFEDPFFTINNGKNAGGRMMDYKKLGERIRQARKALHY